ncbi:methyltransferase domain containing protein [Nitzschia inconspicua]|uniref:Methyltransferase domain containing protein n=1 Tax=Nitzschia inconspicua TaxID=303405 RepID=A0A9K3LRD2_9STRA|nr:methyltransferase domain containing protein [Nitzschia inconspicua]
MREQSKHSKRGTTVIVPLLTGAVLVSLGGLLQQNVRASLSIRLATSATANSCDYPTADASHSQIDENKHSSYRQAFEESLGFFDDINSRDWELLRNITMGRVNNANPQRPLAQSWRASQWYQTNWDPDFSCRHDTKIGIGDGGKWICDPHRLASQSRRRMEQYQNERRMGNYKTGEIRSGCLIYSIGSEGDFRFEEGFQDAFPGTCEIHTFDFTNYSANVPQNKNIHFHHWGLKASYKEDKAKYEISGFGPPSPRLLGTWPFKTFQETIRELGHEGRPIDIFKIDCEGCEWSTYKDWLGADLRQILIEVHKVPKIAQDFFLDLQKAGYVTFHKEPNIQFGGGECVEYAFLKLNTSYVEDRLPQLSPGSLGQAEDN